MTKSSEPWLKCNTHFFSVRICTDPLTSVKRKFLPCRYFLPSGCFWSSAVSSYSTQYTSCAVTMPPRYSHHWYDARTKSAVWRCVALCVLRLRYLALGLWFRLVFMFQTRFLGFEGSGIGLGLGLGSGLRYLPRWTQLAVQQKACIFDNHWLLWQWCCQR